MANAADQIIDGVATHTFSLLRVAAGERAKVLAHLEDLEGTLAGEIEKAAGKSPLTQAKLAALQAQTKKQITDAYDLIDENHGKALSKIAHLEASKTVNILNGAIGVQVATVGQTPEQLAAVAGKSFVQGLHPSEWWGKQAAGLQDKFTAQMRQGMSLGEGVDKLVKRVRGTKAMSYTDGIMVATKAQAEALVRTSVITVANEARIATILKNPKINKGIEWVATLDNRTTSICFGGSTKVFPIGRLLRVFRRTYQDHVLIVATAAGEQFTVTPNHPVLTSGGWRQAKELQPGDKIAKALIHDVISIGDDVKMETDFTTLANAVFHPAISKITIERAPTADLDSYGVCGDHEIEVAEIHSELRDDFNPFPVESVEYQTLVWMHRTGCLTTFAGLGALRFRGLPPVQPSELDASSLEMGKQGAFTDTEPDHYFGWPEAFAMEGDSRIGAGVLCATRDIDHNAKLLQQRSDGCCGGGKLNSDGASGDARPVQFDDIVSVRSEFGNHTVFNMETSQGVYSACGLIVKNCRALDGKQWTIPDFKPIGHDKKFPGATAHWACRSCQVPVTYSWKELAGPKNKLKDQATGTTGDIKDLWKAKVDAAPPAEKKAIETAMEATKASMDGQVSALHDFDSWLQTKSEQFQDELLGKTKADMWRAGKISMTDLTNQDNRPLTIAQLHQMVHDNASMPTPVHTEGEDGIALAERKVLEKAMARGITHDEITTTFADLTTGEAVTITGTAPTPEQLAQVKGLKNLGILRNTLAPGEVWTAADLHLMSEIGAGKAMLVGPTGKVLTLSVVPGHAFTHKDVESLLSKYAVQASNTAIPQTQKKFAKAVQDIPSVKVKESPAGAIDPPTKAFKEVFPPLLEKPAPFYDAKAAAMAAEVQATKAAAKAKADAEALAAEIATKAAAEQAIADAAEKAASLMDAETASTKWMTYEEAKAAIVHSDPVVAARDLKVLDAAFKVVQESDGKVFKDLIGEALPVAPPKAKTPISKPIPTTPLPQPSPVAPVNEAAFPLAPQTLPVVKKLSGSTGAVLVTDPKTGTQYVRKQGSSPEHVREEITTDRAYAAMSVPTPESMLYEGTPGGPTKLSVYLGDDTQTLGQFLNTASPVDVLAMKKQLQAHFALDALLGNYDVIGMGADNILIKSGTAYRIDNGGGLRFRAQGKEKGAAFGPVVTEIDTLRDAKINSNAANIFGYIPEAEIKAQVRDMVARRDELLAVFPDDLRPLMAQRLESLAARYGVQAIPPPAPAPAIPADIGPRIQQARLNGLSILGDAGDVEDQQTLVWQEKDAAGNPITKMQMKLTFQGAQRLQNTLGVDYFATAPATPGGPITHPKDTYWPIIQAAQKTTNYHANDGAYNPVKVAAMASAKAELQAAIAAKVLDAEGTKMASQYLGYIALIERAQTLQGNAATKTVPVFSQFTYKPKVKVKSAAIPTAPGGIAITKSDLKFPVKKIDRGYAQENPVEEPNDASIDAGSAGPPNSFLLTKDDMSARFIRPSGTLGRQRALALQGLVEITIPGAASAENIARAHGLMEYAGIDLTPPSKEAVELVYLRRGVYMMNRKNDPGFDAIVNTTQPEADRIKAAKAYIAANYKDAAGRPIKLPDKPTADYDPEGMVNRYGDGFRSWKRWDTNRAQIESELKDYVLTHSTKNLLGLVEGVLNSGGEFTPTMERLRKGVPIRKGTGKSSHEDFHTGGASYAYTRIRKRGANADKAGQVHLKIGGLERQDVVTFTGDHFGSPQYIATDRQRTFDKYRQIGQATGDWGDETIFKGGVNFLDELDTIVAANAAERTAIIDIFKKHGYASLPDGRKIETVIRTK